MVVEILTMVRRNEAFGAAVGRLLDERSLSLRAQRHLTGIDHDTASQMRRGVVPRMDKVIQFAQGLGLNVNEWLVLAGYAPIEPEWDPDRALMIGIRRIQQESGSDFQVSTEDLHLPEETPEAVEAVLAAIRRRVEQRNSRAGPPPEGTVEPDRVSGEPTRNRAGQRSSPDGGQ
jgi:hypothetical protein